MSEINETRGFVQKRKFMYIGHRGFRVGGVMENSLTAFHTALQYQMDYLELDIHASKDDILYVLHDDKLDRTTTGKGPIRKKKHVELQQLRLKGQSERVPTLRDVITLMQTTASTKKLMIELKSPNIEEKLIRLLKDFHFDSQVCISGRDIDQFRRLHILNPSLPLCLNITTCPQFPVKKFLASATQTDLPLPFTMISLRSSEIAPEFIQKCHRFHIIALAWDFIHDSQWFDTMKRLIREGIDGFLFDDPMTVSPIRSYLDLDKNSKKE